MPRVGKPPIPPGFFSAVTPCPAIGGLHLHLNSSTQGAPIATMRFRAAVERFNAHSKRTIVKRFRWAEEVLPVETGQGESRRLVGLLLRADVMRRYREEMLRR